MTSKKLAIAGQFMIAKNGNTPVVIQADEDGKVLISIAETDIQVVSNRVSKAFNIVPNNGADLAVNAISLTCSVSGMVYVDFVDGGTNIPIMLVAGYWNPIKVKRVYVTGTTATGIVGQEI